MRKSADELNRCFGILNLLPAPTPIVIAKAQQEGLFETFSTGTAVNLPSAFTSVLSGRPPASTRGQALLMTNPKVKQTCSRGARREMEEESVAVVSRRTTEILFGDDVTRPAFDSRTDLQWERRESGYERRDTTLLHEAAFVNTVS